MMILIVSFDSDDDCFLVILILIHYILDSDEDDRHFYLMMMMMMLCWKFRLLLGGLWYVFGGLPGHLHGTREVQQHAAQGARVVNLGEGYFRIRKCCSNMLSMVIETAAEREREIYIYMYRL